MEFFPRRRAPNPRLPHLPRRLSIHTEQSALIYQIIRGTCTRGSPLTRRLPTQVPHRAVGFPRSSSSSPRRSSRPRGARRSRRQERLQVVHGPAVIEVRRRDAGRRQPRRQPRGPRRRRTAGPIPYSRVSHTTTTSRGDRPPGTESWAHEPRRRSSRARQAVAQPEAWWVGHAKTW